MAHYATLETSADVVKRRNFFNVVILFSAVWMVFQFVSIYLFGVFLESPALVGVFLGLGSAVAMAVDIPVGVLQKYFNPRSLIIFASALMLAVGGIFTYLIMGAGIAKEAAAAAGGNAVVGAVASFFFGHMGNVLLIGVAAVLYGLVSEFYDVTTLSYLMNNADPSEYGELISKKNVCTGVGSVAGLVLAMLILLAKGATGAAMFFLIMVPFLVTIGLLLFFVTRYFDNATSAVSLKEIYKLKVIATRGAADAKAFVEDPKNKLKEYAVATVQTADFQKIASNLKVVLLKPMELRKKVDFAEVAKISKKEFRGLWDTLLNPKFRNFKILWITASILLFGYWDTFVVTYLADYLNTTYKTGSWAYLLIGLIAIPVFTLQMPFIKVSQKVGYYVVTAAGVALSAAAAFCFLLPGPLTMFLAFGLLNAVGYAAAMPLAQSVFSEYYNELYARNYGLSEIDSNTSAAPLKVTLNLANVFGSAFGGLLITVNYGFSFFVYGAMLAGLLAVGVVNKKRWGL